MWACVDQGMGDRMKQPVSGRLCVAAVSTCDVLAESAAKSNLLVE